MSARASRQRGLLTLDDLTAARLDRRAIRRREQTGALHPLFPGVWAFGHTALTREAWQLAGVLSVGGDALLDGASACQLYGVFRRNVGRVFVVTGRPVRSRARLQVRRAERMPRRCRRSGIPVVTIEEALLGLAACPAVTDAEVRAALRRAMTERHTTFERLRSHAVAAKGRPGVRRFRGLLLDDRAPRSKSALEAAALRLLQRYGISAEQNVLVDGLEADIVTADGTIVELDSQAFHDNPISAADDEARHDRWVANGRRVERLTWDDVHVRPVKTIRRVTA